MKNLSYTIQFVYWLTIGFIVIPITFAQGQSGIDLLSRVQQNRILLRWIPNTPEAWQAANQTGYVVTRTTLTSANGNPSPTKTVTINGIQATDQPLWQAYLNPDSIQYATIYYLTVNDVTNFQRPPASITDSLSGHAAVTPQFTLDERYVYVTIAANTRFAAAVKAGLGYIDSDVKPGETYRYTVSTTATAVANGASQSITSASVVLGLADYAPLPKPVLVQPVQQQKRQITLSWNSEQHQSIYGSYDIERATNLTGTFRRLNELPYVQLADSSQYLYYPDSLPNQTRIYQYRIIGRSYFDEAQISNPVAVTIVQELQSLPGVSSVRTDKNQYTINWRYPLDGANIRLDTLISQFSIAVSNQDTTGFKSAGQPVNYSSTTATIAASTIASLVDTTKSYYFRVSAIGLSGDVSHSLPYIIVPQDVSPPGTPQGVLVSDLNASNSGATTHLIRVEWRPNTETDLLGYQVFRQIGTEVEKIEVSGGIRAPISIVDTLNRNIGLPLITYFVWAYDQHYHRSVAAGIGKFQQPDVKGPMPPLLTGYSQVSSGVVLNWDPSPSSLMEPIRYDLLRRELSGSDNWQVILSTTAGDTIRQYTDESASMGTTYVYSLVAYDQTGNASCFKRNPGTPADCYQLLVVKVTEREQLAAITSFTAVFDTLTNQVQLGWQYNQPGVQTYELYKARAAFKPSAWKTLDGSILNTTDIDIDSGLTYVYQLRAVFSDGSSTPWAPVTITCRRISNSLINQPPRLSIPPVSQYAVVGKPFSYTLPANSFTDADGQLVSILYAGNFPPGLTAQGPRLTGTPTQPGSYTLTLLATDDKNARVQTSLVMLVEKALSAPIIYGVGTICAGQSTTLTAANCTGDIRWSTGATGLTLVVSPQQTLSYSAVCQTTLQTSSASMPFQVTVVPNLSAPNLTKSTICLGNAATLSATNCPGELQWSVGHTASQLTVSPVVTTVYTATCILAGCISPVGSTTVIVNRPPSLSITGNLTPCAGQATLLSAQAPGATAYRWSTGETSSSISTSISGVYVVTAAYETGCTQSDSVQVETSPPVTVAISGSTALCAGSQTYLTAYGGKYYKWNTGATTATISVSSTGPYSVTVNNNNGCSASAGVQVTNASATVPVASISSSSITTGQSITLSASGCTGTVSWFQSTTALGSGQTLVITPTISSTYTARCSIGNCTSSLSAPVMVSVGNSSTIPDPPLLAVSSSTICAGQSITLTASNCPGTVDWSSGNMGTSIIVTPNNNISYSATCTTNGQTSAVSDPLSIVVNTSSGTASITASPSLSLCAGQTLTLTASNGSGYQWSNGATSQAISVTAAGTYTVSVSTGSSCPALASVTVVSAGRVADELSSPVAGLSFRYYQQAFSNADVDAMTGQTPTAQGTVANFNLNAQANHPADNYGYEFVGYVQVTTPGEYTFYTDSDDGSKLWIGSQLLVDNNYVHASRTVSGQLCLGVGYHAIRVRFTQAYEGAVLNVSWQGPDFAKQPIPDNKLFRNNCPSPSITGNLVVCTGQSTTLTASSASSYRWSTGATTASISTSLTGTYSLTATNANGCWATTTATVISGSQPGTASITASPSLSLCAGQTLTLTASNGSGYQWNNGATSQAISVTVAGTYTVSVSTGSSCPALASVTVVSAGRVADELSSPVAGLSFRYYQQAFSNADVDAMTGQTPTAQGTVANFNLNAQANHPADNYGYEFVGYVQVTTPGEYTFYTDSDDGSKLWIGSQLLVDNNYVHASRTVSGQLCLGVGYHAIRVRFTQAYEGAVLNVSWQGPDFAKQPIPDNKLFR